jgi:serine/threonine protein kinase
MANLLAGVGATSKEAGAPTEAAAEDFRELIGEGCKYKKRRLLGTGSFGKAYLLEDKEGATVVGKILDLSKMSSREKEYAFCEIKCLANCNHPNVIKYYDDFEEAEKLLIIMEFADAGDLDRQVKTRAADSQYFLEHEVMFMFLQLCLAVNHLHRQKMLHRDIKAANIFLCTTGLVKLGDLGFSKQYEESVSCAVAQTFCGTPYYLAPELWTHKKYNKKADIWSCGILLYEMMALKKPFAASGVKQLKEKVLGGVYDPLPPQYSEALKTLVPTILVADPSKRPNLRDIFRLPVIREGFKNFIETLKRNSAISEVTRSQLIESAMQALADEPDDETSGICSANVGEVRNDVFYEGPIKKPTLKEGKQQWSDRYLILRGADLLMCDSKEEAANGKVLTINVIHSVCPVRPQTARAENVFALNTTTGKCTWLQAPSQKEMLSWIHKLQVAIGEA